MSERSLARVFIQSCRRRAIPTASSTDLLEQITATIGQMPVEDRAAALDALRWHLGEALNEMKV